MALYELTIVRPGHDTEIRYTDTEIEAGQVFKLGPTELLVVARVLCVESPLATQGYVCVPTAHAAAYEQARKGAPTRESRNIARPSRSGTRIGLGYGDGPVRPGGPDPLAGRGPTLFAGLSQHVDLKLVSRLEFSSGAVAMRYEPRSSHRAC